MPPKLPERTYTAVEAFPGVRFDGTVAIVSAPGETNRLFIVEQSGRILVITNLASPTQSVFLDLRDRIYYGGEAGLLGLAFHPDYRSNGRFYVFYTLNTITPALDGSQNQGLHDRLSQFAVSPTNPHRAQPDSELPLITQFDRASNHNGGDLHFGPDGCLYVSLGDEGGGGDNYGNSQRIDHNFFSGILRLDVDKRPGSLPPNPHPAVTDHYAIPADNPFVGVTSHHGLALDPGRVRTEFWAVGLRNPWRFSFDSVTGTLFCGDVGQGSMEEVNVIVRGGNYGWRYFEGSQFNGGVLPPGFNHLEPIAAYRRPGVSLDLERQGYCVIGGRVYRGSRLPELYGKYVFGDFGSGYVWSLRYDGTQVTDFRRLYSGYSMTSFGEDPRNGDILIGSWTVLRLVAAEPAAGQELPPTLGGTGVFANPAALTPNPGVVPYEINVSFWSDHAQKRRWFSVPGLSQSIGFSREGNWSFPAGTVWVKHFDLEQIEGVPASARRIETRLLVRTTSGVYGVTYRWADSTGDAMLVPAEGFEETFVIQEAGGATRNQVWRYPGRSECLSCHTPVAGHALGFNAAQLNRLYHYGAGAGAANQIEALALAGYFGGNLPNLQGLVPLAPPDDPSASIEHRVRSYLAANCANCHQPGGPSTGLWDARATVALSSAGIIDGLLNNPGGNPNARVIRPGSIADSMLLSRIGHRGPGQMPPLGSTTVDQDGLALLSYWVTNVLAQPPRRDPLITWPRPAPIAYGTPLSAAQLAAASDVPGTFVYLPKAGAVLPSGLTQPLSARFLPTEPDSIRSVTAVNSIDVLPAPLTIIAMDQRRRFGEPNPTFAAQYTGWVAGDTPSSLSQRPSFTTPATRDSPPGLYPIHAGGAIAPNYRMTYVPGVLTIDPPTGPLGAERPGTYVGLFHEVGGVQHDRAGYVQLAVSRNGAYSARLEMIQSRLPFSGRLGVDLTVSNRVAHPTAGDVGIVLEFPKLDPASIRGRITTASWTAELEARRVRPAAPGQFTWISATPDQQDGPEGESFGRVRISASGRGTLTGQLPLGLTVGAGVKVCEDGRWPLRIPLEGGRGSLFGWVALTNDASRLTGALTWTQPAGQRSIHPEAFRVQSALVGSAQPVEPPGMAQTNFLVAFNRGGTGGWFTNRVTLDEQSRGWKSTSPGTMALRWNRTSGLFSGTVAIPPLPAVRFGGAYLRHQGYGAGSVQDRQIDARVLVQPVPEP